MKLKLINLSTTIYAEQTIFNPNFDLNPKNIGLNQLYILFRT